MSEGQRPGKLHNILQCTGQPPPQIIIWPKTSTGPKLRNPAPTHNMTIKEFQRLIERYLTHGLHPDFYSSPQNVFCKYFFPPVLDPTTAFRDHISLDPGEDQLFSSSHSHL